MNVISTSDTEEAFKIAIEKAEISTKFAFSH